ncbi:hypothetical protein OpiT1DRAFT_01279 [Opitutaceae bacterium TAV1]|nr:hypothetical protein OpiT1DRAFT_01279 [Opitutaceae bacterium TAV1]
MIPPPVQTPAGKLIHLCACCESAVGVRPDHELDGMVCADCHTKGNWAKAWLKTAGIRGCVRIEDKRRGGAG